MFVIDAAGSEGRDPVEDLMSLKEELRLYDVELAGKPAFVVANKTDLRGGCPFAGKTPAPLLLYGAQLHEARLPIGGYSGRRSFFVVHATLNRRVKTGES